MRHYFSVMGGLICVFGTLVYASSPRRNIVFILADDLGLMDLSVEGSRFYETPNIDKLARSGMRFTQGYATCQVCSPSRASIMTGKYPARTGITSWIGDAQGSDWKRNTKLLPAVYQWQLDHKEITLAETFRAAGYRTFFAGKWRKPSQTKSFLHQILEKSGTTALSVAVIQSSQVVFHQSMGIVDIYKHFVFCCAGRMISRLLILAPPCVGDHRRRYSGMSN